MRPDRTLLSGKPVQNQHLRGCIRTSRETLKIVLDVSAEFGMSTTVGRVPLPP